MRIFDGDILLEIHGFTCRDGLGCCLNCLNRQAIGAEDGGLKRNFARGVGLIDNGGLHMDDGKVSCDLGRADEYAPMVNVDRISGDEANVAIDALTGVPAGSRLKCGIGADSKDIGLVIAEV